MTDHESLAQLVKRVMRSTEDPDRGPEFVTRVLDEISDDMLRPYLREALSRVVHVYDNEARREGVRKLVSAAKTPVQEAETVVGSPRVVSVKQELLRTVYWPQYLKESIPVPGGRKALGSATVDDLLFYRDNLRDHARMTLKNAQRANRLIQMLRDSGVSTVGELDLNSVEALYAS